MSSTDSVSTRTVRWTALLACLTAATMLMTSPADADAAKVAIAKSNSAKNMRQGSQYVVAGRVVNRTAREVRANVRVTLSKRRNRAGSILLGKKRRVAISAHRPVAFPAGCACLPSGKDR